MKMKKRICWCINIFFVLVFIGAVLFPVERKTAAYTNTEIDEYSDLSSVPKIGSITDHRSAEISFGLYHEKLYGICLFFYAEGKQTEGEILCTLKHGQEIVSEQTIPVRELFALMSEKKVKLKEILLGDGQSCEGRYTLLMQGKGISPETRISLYANRSTERFLEYTNAGCQNFYEPLYIVETLEPERPFVWGAAFVLALSLLFSYTICMDVKEKRLEKQ